MVHVRLAGDRRQDVVLIACGRRRKALSSRTAGYRQSFDKIFFLKGRENAKMRERPKSATFIGRQGSPRRSDPSHASTWHEMPRREMTCR
eukprot:7754683-Pyramimonas_sp.AAC.1